jgi:hypothetical protein
MLFDTAMLRKYCHMFNVLILQFNSVQRFDYITDHFQRQPMARVVSEQHERQKSPFRSANLVIGWQ